MVAHLNCTDTKTANEPMVPGHHSQGSSFPAFSQCLQLPKLGLELGLGLAVAGFESGESWEWRPGIQSPAVAIKFSILVTYTKNIIIALRQASL